MSTVEVRSGSDTSLSFPWARGRDDVLAAASPSASYQRVEWEIHQLVVEIRLRAEEAGGFSVHVPELPGVVSQGETEQEAEENIREALAAAIESYRESQEETPWEREPVPAQPGERSRWIVVHV